MNKYIIAMKDGGIKDIETDDFVKSYGCETCGYGGWHIKKLKLEMEGLSFLIDMESMYDFELPSQQQLIFWFDENTEQIKSMTQEEFMQFMKKNHNFTCDEIKFSIKKDV